jgi:uncharacterized membrane protein
LRRDGAGGTGPAPFALPPYLSLKGGSMQRQANQIIQSATAARAGETGHNVRTVLAVSTIGVAVSLVAVYLYFFV